MKSACAPTSFLKGSSGGEPFRRKTKQPLGYSTTHLMDKKENRYHLRLEQAGAKTGELEPATLDLTFGSHDDLLQIVQRVQDKALFTNAEEAAQFAIGLKMFSEVMLKHRDHPLFAELKPAFGSFMKKLKAS